jgi:hypothetical protein
VHATRQLSNHVWLLVKKETRGDAAAHDGTHGPRHGNVLRSRHRLPATAGGMILMHGESTPASPFSDDDPMCDSIIYVFV